MHSQIPTVLIQSQRDDRLDGWQGRCCESVRAWAGRHGIHYQFLADELFDVMPAELGEKFADQAVVRADLARLLVLRERLEAGYERALWIDADTLLFRDLPLRECREAFGRECWIQLRDGRPRPYRKIQNAWMLFHRGSPVLDFYIDRATQLLRSANAPVVPQFVGPKLLSAWHNICPFTTEERAGMLSPLAHRALVDNNRDTLKLLIEGHGEDLGALNLSASCENRTVDGITLRRDDYHKVIDGLLDGSLSDRLTLQPCRR